MSEAFLSGIFITDNNKTFEPNNLVKSNGSSEHLPGVIHYKNFVADILILPYKSYLIYFNILSSLNNLVPTS